MQLSRKSKEGNYGVFFMNANQAVMPRYEAAIFERQHWRSTCSAVVPWMEGPNFPAFGVVACVAPTRPLE